MPNNMDSGLQFHVTLVTLYPDMFPGSLGSSLAGRALQDGIWGFKTIQIRDFAHDKHAHVDDTPYGGGAGMVIRPDIVAQAIDNAVECASSVMSEPPQLLHMSPRGALLTQKRVKTLAFQKNIIILCGRFEGIDQRVLDAYAITEISVGDYILSGGEMAALAVMDASIRLLPGVMGGADSAEEESFSPDSAYENLLEYPHYTRPATWQGREVPEVLRSGDHQAIADWRREQAEQLTQQRRPDVWASYQQSHKRVKIPGSNEK